MARGPRRSDGQVPRQRWVLEFAYSFEFDAPGIATQTEAQDFGSTYVDEAVRGSIATYLREYGFVVEVGSAAAYYPGSVGTRGLARVLAEFRDIPGIAEHLTHAEWFWEQLNIALGTRLGKHIALRKKWSAVVSALPVETKAMLAPVQFGDQPNAPAQATPTPTETPGASDEEISTKRASAFDLGDQLGALAKILIALVLLVLPYACGYLQGSGGDDAKWRELIDAVASNRSDIVVTQEVSNDCGGRAPGVSSRVQSIHPAARGWTGSRTCSGRCCVGH